jgi:hypothetical protein
MPRKKSVKHTARQFRTAAEDIMGFLSNVSANQSDEHVSWLYNYAIIRLYREFETLMLHALIGGINNDTEILSSKTGIRFPLHLSDEVCEYTIRGTGYFDFKGRDGLIKEIKKYVPDTHYLVTTVKKPKYKDALEKLSTLRNYAAHESAASKRAALIAVGQQRLGSSGSWLKRQGRFNTIKDKLKELAAEIERSAPY